MEAVRAIAQLDIRRESLGMLADRDNYPFDMSILDGEAKGSENTHDYNADIRWTDPHVLTPLHRRVIDLPR